MRLPWGWSARCDFSYRITSYELEIILFKMGTTLLRMLRAALMLSLLVCTNLGTLHAEEAPNQAVDVYLIDVSASMSGRGSVASASVFGRMQQELTAAFDQVIAERGDMDVVLIPFATHPFEARRLTLPGDSSALRTFVQSLRPRAGRTDIYQAWQEGLQQLNPALSRDENRLFLITDGLHNSKRYSADSLQSLLGTWTHQGKDAYLVLLDPSYDSSELAAFFTRSEHMQVIHSLAGMYDRGATAVDSVAQPTPPQTVTETKAATESDPEADSGWSDRFIGLPWWLCLLLAILIIAAYIYFTGSKKGVSAAELDSELAPQDAKFKERVKQRMERRKQENKEKETQQEEAEKKHMKDQDILATKADGGGYYSLVYGGDDSALIKQQRQAMRPEYQYVSAAQRDKFSGRLKEDDEASGTILEWNMFQVMDPRSKELKRAMGGAEAHHVIAGNAPAAQKARKILESCNYNINDPINGIFLPQGAGKQSATTTRYIGVCHETSHSNEYHEAVYRRLQHLEQITDIAERRKALGKELDAIRGDLRAGRLALNTGERWYIMPNGEHVQRTL